MAEMRTTIRPLSIISANKVLSNPGLSRALDHGLNKSWRYMERLTVQDCLSIAESIFGVFQDDKTSYRWYPAWEWIRRMLEKGYSSPLRVSRRV